jgi:hypothetical protein
MSGILPADIPSGIRLDDGLTPDEAVAVALWNNAAFQVSVSALGFARADLLEAGVLTNPVLSLLFPVGRSGSSKRPSASVVVVRRSRPSIGIARTWARRTGAPGIGGQQNASQYRGALGSLLARTHRPRRRDLPVAWGAPYPLLPSMTSRRIPADSIRRSSCHAGRPCGGPERGRPTTNCRFSFPDCSVLEPRSPNSRAKRWHRSWTSRSREVGKMRRRTSMIAVAGVVSLGACDKAPMFQLQNGSGLKYYENQTVEDAVKLIGELRN